MVTRQGGGSDVRHNVLARLVPGIGALVLAGCLSSRWGLLATNWSQQPPTYILPGALPVGSCSWARPPSCQRQGQGWEVSDCAEVRPLSGEPMSASVGLPQPPGRSSSPAPACLELSMTDIGQRGAQPAGEGSKSRPQWDPC